MAEVGARFFEEMLDRLYAALSTGPNLNCRPHSSRQRVDFHAIAQLGDVPAEDLLMQLFLEGKAVITAKKPENLPDPSLDEEKLSAEAKAARRTWQKQQAMLNKLRAIAEDTLTFEQDTGAHVLNLGFPLVNVPPGQRSAGRAAAGKRLLAPIALMPVHLTISRGRASTVELVTTAERSDRILANEALFSWVERQTGKSTADLFTEEASDDPYREINKLIAYIKDALGLTGACQFEPGTPLVVSPRADDESPGDSIVPAGVLGLFPYSNQSLIDDTEAFRDGEPLRGPAQEFVVAQPTSLEQTPEGLTDSRSPSQPWRLAEDYLIAPADPCQAGTVRLARHAPILVVHGPPGTGKSQTIVNVIGDHLARGQRVLLVCDKRIALDVVYYRLDRLGLGNLCAVVHDAHSDQRDLYRSVREQLEALADTRADDGATDKLGRCTKELQKLHDDLTAYFAGLSAKPEPAAASFHELVGAWLAAPGPDSSAAADHDLKDLSLVEGEQKEAAVREILQRGRDCDYANNPWTPAAGCTLSRFLGESMDGLRRRMADLAETARQTDALADPAVPAFAPTGDVMAAGRDRTHFGEVLAATVKKVASDRLMHWARQAAERVREAKTHLEEQDRFVRVLQEGPLDRELLQIHKDEPLRASQIAPWLVILDDYLDIAAKWYGFVCLGRKKAATPVLQRFGLRLNAVDAARLKTFLTRLRAHLALLDFHDSVVGPQPLTDRFDDALLQNAIADHAAILELFAKLDGEPHLAALGATVRQAFLEPERREGLLRGLQLAAPRAEAVARLEAALASSGLFAPDWLNQARAQLRAGKHFGPNVADLAANLGKLEGVLRVHQEVATLPSALGGVVRNFLGQSLDVDQGWNVLHKSLLRAEITRRLQAQPLLQDIDGAKIQAMFDRYRVLDERRKTLGCEHTLATWVQRQRERLLVSTGSRLNSLGAELGRRLMLRGKRAMRLRQVIKTGAAIEGGDPLFDLRPVWMAGPSTVAELFARASFFDVVIFDEASQCRLEEALPVLTRGKRVVIAGDPKQLPPTRFFESGVVASEDDEPETDQELFEAQQAHADDLLTAALNLPVERSYLDVHYRSHNADLIEFSNRNFYEARLQPIPGHPANKPFDTPVRLHRVNGTYENRVNPAEATQVVKIVRELLRRAEPPSIGIACFNISQRDQIVEALDEAAAADPEFARRLADARSRKGTGSFEGLFVRNLENVQGDERDYMIISTTYGPDSSGKFYRRFGPLGLAGGGRRLNVLVTRARDEVHLVTSIPIEVYRSMPALPPGATPNGGWLLFSYLRYAEELEHAYEAYRQGSQERQEKPGQVHVQDTESPSLFSRALAQSLANRQGFSSTVHWGNEGFCVDVALHDPQRNEDVTLGVLCDGCRFGKASDPVEWDVFRTAILEGQGWKLKRLWTPHFVRDVSGSVDAIVAAARATERRPTDRDVLPF